MRLRSLSPIFTTIPGLLLTPVFFSIFSIKLLPAIAILCYGIILTGTIIYPISQYKKYHRWAKAFAGTGIAIIVGVVSAVFIRHVILQACYVEHSGMRPLVTEGTRLIGDRTSYWFKQPTRSDFIIYEVNANGHDNQLMLSRIVGLPGEKIEVKQGEVWINGNMLQEKYLSGVANNRESCPMVQLPKDSYLILLDNRTMAYRPETCDSLIIKRNQLVAKVASRFFSWEALR
jgi:signal peptidase I